MVKRKTKVSDGVIEILKKAASPLSAFQILDQLKYNGLYPNKTTIYRIINKLLNTRVISEIATKNKGNVYELFTKNHFHFICNQCDDISCLDDDKAINIDALISDKKFKIESKNFNFYGVCELCL